MDNMVPEFLPSDLKLLDYWLIHHSVLACGFIGEYRNILAFSFTLKTKYERKVIKD